MKIFVLALLIGVLIQKNILHAQEISPQDAIKAFEEVVKKIKECPREEEVFKEKKGFFKHSWGPVSDVIYDMGKSDSIIYPYSGFIEFAVPRGYYSVHKLQQDAANDDNPNTKLAVRYRYNYKIGASRIVLESTLSKGMFSGDWEKTTLIKKSCWDKITD